MVRTDVEFSGGASASDVASGWGDAAAERGPQSIVVVAFGWRLLAIGLGALHAWTAAVQQSMSEDGISYLDMGDAYLRGDWSTAINPYWSPLYAWVLGLTMKVLQPSMAWEFPAVHVVNFVIYLFALGSFDFFWRNLSYSARDKVSTGAGDGLRTALPEWLWLSIGYALFIWSSLSLIKIWAVTPDMLTAGLVFIASGFMLRIGTEERNWRTFAVFGFVLGLACLAKGVMLPLSVVFLAAAFMMVGTFRSAISGLAAALLSALVLVLPWVLILSLATGKLTFSDSGTFTYLKYANGIPYPHWRSGLVSHLQVPVKAARQIFEEPAVYEFATPIGGTYPLSYNPTYWYEGVSPRFDIQGQLRTLTTSALFYFDLFIRQQGGMTVTVLLLLLVTTRRFRRHQKHFRVELGLLVVAIVAFGLYALVYVEGRYIAPFVVLFWAALLSCIRLPVSSFSTRLLRAVGSVLLLVICINIATFNLEGLTKIGTKHSHIGQAESPAEAPRYKPLEMAEAILQMGLQPGDEIAFIGYSFGAFFARLARVRIIADIPDEEAERFWRADEPTRSAAIEAIRSTGAKAIIAEWVSPGVSLGLGWERIGQSRHFLYVLR